MVTVIIVLPKVGLEGMNGTYRLSSVNSDRDAVPRANGVESTEGSNRRFAAGGVTGGPLMMDKVRREQIYDASYLYEQQKWLYCGTSGNERG